MFASHSATPYSTGSSGGVPINDPNPIALEAHEAKSVQLELKLTSLNSVSKAVLVLQAPYTKNDPFMQATQSLAVPPIQALQEVSQAVQTPSLLYYPGGHYFLTQNAPAFTTSFVKF